MRVTLGRKQTTVNRPTAELDIAHLCEHLQASVYYIDADRQARPLAFSDDDERLPLDEVARGHGDEKLAEVVSQALAGDTVDDEFLVVDRGRVIRRVTPVRSGESVVGCWVSYQSRSSAEHRSRSQAAHDLRSPLSVILMWAKLIRQKPMTDQQRTDGLDTIIRNAELQRDLIENQLGRDDKRG
jgi:His Kinase A (phospho-acceptor) domain